MDYAIREEDLWMEVLPQKIIDHSIFIGDVDDTIIAFSYYILYYTTSLRHD